ncbi:MAG: class I SAM-dependent methyltransferase [Chloroflexi bacterium]|nr:class I SAM-dependent methyltransferase [Chloroflexota bacterium]
MPKDDRQVPHPGGDQKFWRDEMVKRYEYQQSLVSEKKEELLANIARIINYFCEAYSIDVPRILDIGSGPGTPTTLCMYILDKVPKSVVVGIDSSEQMAELANDNLVPKYGHRFSGVISDFNSERFWMADINKKYDFITSSGALHYLSDQRMVPFLKEILDHLEDRGALIACIGNRSMFSQISEMEDVFRIEFTYDQLEKDKRPKNFQEFRRRFEETDRKANINWHSHDEWLLAMKSAGFKEADIVWNLWVRSIFVALK